MIEKTTSFKTSDGVLHATIELAQQSEMVAYLKTVVMDEAADFSALAASLITYKDRIINILTMKASSHPRARKANGATKKRTKKGDATPPLI